jgi:hypothetical protein
MTWIAMWTIAGQPELPTETFEAESFEAETIIEAEALVESPS